MAIRQFRRIWFAGLVSGTLRWLEILAIGLFVLAQTGSAFAVALFFFLRMMPMFCLGIFLGALMSYFELKALYRFALGTLALTYAVLLGVDLGVGLALWHVAIGCVVSGLCWAVDLPVRRLIVADAVGATRVTAAMGLESAAQNFTRVAGPLVGGVVFAFLGLRGTYGVGVVVCAGLFLYGSGLHPVVSVLGRGKQRFLDTLREGIGFASRQPRICLVLGSTLLVNVFGFSYTTLVPVIAVQAYGANEIQVGVMMSIEGAGALLGSLVLAALRLRGGQAAVYVVACFAFVVAVHLFARVDTYDVALLVLFVAGLAIAGFNTMQSAILLIETPPALRPRVMGLLSFSIGTLPLGVLALGTLAAKLGSATALAIWTLVGLGGLLLVFVAYLVACERVAKRRA